LETWLYLPLRNAFAKLPLNGAGSLLISNGARERRCRQEKWQLSGQDEHGNIGTFLAADARIPARGPGCRLHPSTSRRSGRLKRVRCCGSGRRDFVTYCLSGRSVCRWLSCFRQTLVIVCHIEKRFACFTFRAFGKQAELRSPYALPLRGIQTQVPAAADCAGRQRVNALSEPCFRCAQPISRNCLRP
jgi:hypothetical protein